MCDVSIPYIPLYVTDYEADTAHLTIEEDGAYLRLLRLCWRTPGCSVPDEPKWIMRKMRISADDYYRVVEPIIDEFFMRGMERVFNARLQAEHERINETHKKRSDAGVRGNEKRWALKTNDKANRPATSLRSQLELEPELEPEPKQELKKKEEPKGSLSSGDDVTVAFDDYNSMALEAGWPIAKVLNSKRRSSLRARLSDAGGIDGWSDALSKARSAPFLNGKNKNGWKASLDFLLQQSSFIKLMEGNYDLKKPNPQDFNNKLKESLRAGNFNPDTY